jgi:outer membrane lipopolysaccharide assembly protein LptE/RlpB
MIKRIVIIITLILLAECGFSPMHSKKNNINYSIELINYSGERDLNNLLRINLMQYKNQSKNKFFVEIESEYTKNTLTKDTTGKITNYELIAKVKFILKNKDRKIEFTEKKIMETMDDNFEQNKYERSIKQNFSTSLVNKLISSLNIIQ